MKQKSIVLFQDFVNLYDINIYYCCQLYANDIYDVNLCSTAKFLVTEKADIKYFKVLPQNQSEI